MLRRSIPRFCYSLANVSSSDKELNALKNLNFKEKVIKINRKKLIGVLKTVEIALSSGKATQFFCKKLEHNEKIASMSLIL